MKKIFFVALAATLLAAGCQKTEVINRVGDRIGFSSELNKLTKADGETEDPLKSLKEQDFKVWVYTAYTDELNKVVPGTIYDKMAGLEISDNNGSWGPKDNQVYYWPGKENDLEFYGISTGFEIIADLPELEDKTKANTKITPTADNKIVITGYSVDPDTASDDLMIADFVKQNQKSNNSSKEVIMNFRHALSKVTFAFNTKGTAIVKVKKLIVKDLVINGVVTAEVDNDAVKETETTSPIKLSWTEKPENFVELTDDFEREFKEEIQTLTTGDHVPFTTWLVIPQDLTDKTVEIEYYIGDKKFNHVFALANDTLTNWDVNNSITYNVSLSPNTISFDASVSPWTEKDPVVENN